MRERVVGIVVAGASVLGGCGPDPVPADGTGGAGDAAQTASVTSAAGPTSSSDATTSAATAGGATTDASAGVTSGGGQGGSGGDATATTTTGSSTGEGGAGGGPTGGGGAGGAGGGSSSSGATTSAATTSATTTSAATSTAATGAECVADPDDTPCTGGICCGGACIAANDEANCHACGNACTGAFEVCGATDCALDCASASLTECNGTCIDLSEDDPDHCGACNRSCNGLACTDGACDAELVIEADTTVSGIASTTDAVFASLYSGAATQGVSIWRYTPSLQTLSDVETSMRLWGGITVDGSSLVLADSPNRGMRRCAIADCQNTLSAPVGNLDSFHAHPHFEQGGGFVFGKALMGSNLRLVQCSSSQCGAIVELSPAGFGMAASGSRLYWNDGDDVFSAAIVPLGQPLAPVGYRMNLAAGQPGYGSTFRIVATSDRVYIWEPGLERISSSTMAASPGAVTVEANAVPLLVDLAFADGSLYWTSATPLPLVETCEVEACASSRRVIGALPPGNHYQQMVVDPSHVYVASEYEDATLPTPGLGRVYRVPR